MGEGALITLNAKPWIIIGREAVEEGAVLAPGSKLEFIWPKSEIKAP